MPNEIVELSTNGKQMIRIICEDTKFVIAAQVGEQFPDLIQVKRHKPYTLSQHTFKEMIRQTSLSTENETQEVVVPWRTLSEISKILSSDETAIMNLYFEDKNILFDLGECKVVSRLLEGQFLKYEQAFSSDYTARIQVDRKQFLMRIERAALIAREGKKPIKLEIDGDHMIITSKAELGTAREKLEIELEGNKLSIGLNPKFLIEALKSIDDDRICIHFISPLTPCTINPIQGNHYKYLILPVRMDLTQND